MEDDFIPKLIFDFLFLGRERLISTRAFKKRKHNDDLVPSINGKINSILDFFNRYRKIGYDIQGIRDHGIDVLLSYEIDGQKRLIGFQVKSYDDLEVDGWLTKLKAQQIDVQSYNTDSMLIDYYVLFCTDGVQHRDKIRNATADLVKNSYFRTHVVAPEHCLHFLNLPDSRIGAFIKNKLSGDDIIVRNAKDDFNDFSLAQAAFIIETVVDIVVENKIHSPEIISKSQFADYIYSTFPNLPSYFFDGTSTELDSEDLEENRIEDLQTVIDSSFFTVDEHSNNITFDMINNVSLTSLLFEAIARYEYSSHDLKLYLFHTLLASQIESAIRFTSVETSA
ncbi:MAG TPA: hypothetical protein VGK03_11340 [Geothrix sp.]|jgi:hypothetical protein